jgi:LPXTG-motif cell wall-anchored protein
VATTPMGLLTGVFSLQVMVIAGFTFIVLVVVGVFYSRRRGK